MFDMNDVIFSLGGVDTITAPLDTNVTDEALQYHLDNHVVGTSIPTVLQVRNQIPVLAASFSASTALPSVDVVTPLQIRTALEQIGLSEAQVKNLFAMASGI